MIGKDIVERLKNAVFIMGPDGWQSHSLAKDAADEIERLRKRCADWATSFAEKCNDCEDLKRMNRELADARIADRFERAEREDADAER